MKVDLLLAAMGVAAPEIPEPGSLNFAEMIGKVSDIIDVAREMKEANPEPNQSDTLNVNSVVETGNGFGKNKHTKTIYTIKDKNGIRKDTVNIQ